MIRLLLIADDLTGANDTGVQFARLGLSTEICVDHEQAFATPPSDTDVYVVDTASNVWTDPYPITIAGDRRVGVYTTTTHVGIYIPVKPDDVTLIGREIGSATHYPIVQQTDRYVLWGFDGSPEAMTETGKELFVNLAWYME